MNQSDPEQDVDINSPEARTVRSVKARLCVMMFLQYFVEGCYLPIISVYLQDRFQFDASQLGYVGASLAIGTVVAPFILGQLVDRHIATQHVMAVCHLLSGAVMLLLYFQTSVAAIVVLGTIYSSVYVPSRMLANSMTFHHLVNRDREFPLIRLWGTVGFIVPAWLIELWWLSGLEGQELNTARGVALAMAGIGGLVLGLYSLTLPKTPPPEREARGFAPAKVLALLKVRRFLILILVSFGIAVAHQFYFVWNSPFIKAIMTAGGHEGAWEQRVSSLGQIAEIAVLSGVGLLILRIGFKRVMTIGLISYLVRCLIFAGAAALEEPFGLVMPLVCTGQILHGLCFGCFLAVAYMYVDRYAPRDIRGSMQNVYGTFVVGTGFFFGGLFGGWVGTTFTTVAGQPTVRDQLGISLASGLMPLTGLEQSQEQIRDWPGIWLTCAGLVVVCWIVFALFFPGGDPEESAEDR